MNRPIIMNGIPIPTEYDNSRLNASPGVVAARVSIEPRIGPTHGVQLAAKARPKMIEFLDTLRHTLEELSPELGVTDPHSGTIIVEK